MLDPNLARSIDAAVDRLAPELIDLARKIHEHPELRFEEEKAAAWIAEALQRSGFQVERGLANMPTALKASKGSTHGPSVAILAEYDALPEIGHACGHNLIAAGAVFGFIAASTVVEKTGGQIVLLGTPAEEGGGGKIK